MGHAGHDRVARERPAGGRREGLIIGSAAGALVLVLAALLPGWAAMAFLAPRVDRAGRVGTALALSPIAGGALTALLVATGLSWSSAVLTILATSLAVIALRRVLARAAADALARDTRGNGPRAAWILAGACGLVLGAMYAGSEWWRIYSDAWTHEPIVRALRDHGLPAMDPWYAGFRLQYAWLYHAWVAGLVGATGLSAFTIMSALAVASLAACAMVVGHLAARLGARSAGWATAFVLLAMNGAFVLTLPVLLLQGLLGQDAGPQVLARIFGGVATDADRAQDLLRWFGTQTWFGNKFAGATPFSLGLAAYAAWLASLWRTLEGAARGRRELLLLLVVTAAAGAMHPVLLLFTAGTIALWCGPAVLLADGPRGAALGVVGKVVLATALGAAMPAWYFARLLAPSAGHLAPPFDASLPKLVGLVLSVLPALVFAALAAPGLARAGGARRLWATWLAAGLVLALALRLPGTWPFFTVDKTSYLVWIPLALTGGVYFSTWIARRGEPARIALAALLLAPATTLALGSRAGDARSGWRQPWNRPALAQLRAALPKDALLVVPPGDLDTPIFLARDTFDEDKIDGLVRGYDPAELATRHALVDTLYRAGRLEPALAARLAASERPVYAIWPDRTQAWQARTPGVPQRKFDSFGAQPAWAGALPVKVYGGEYAVSPLTREAILP
ncbi:MAG: hypothetical protein ABI960_09205 [Candidatus Eisenbacteria bacterium]